MASANRNLLACNTCMKLQDKLSVHLRKVCKKSATEEEINRAVKSAKKRRQELVKDLSVVSYDSLNYKKSKFSDPQKFFADFLKRHGCIIQKPPSKRMSSTVRRNLAEIGVYKMHDLDSPIMERFKRYLSNNFAKSSIRKMMENVSRFLYFVNPEDISMGFLKDLEKTKTFISLYSKIKTSNSTVKNYLNHIQQFLQFVVSEKSPNNLSEDMKQDAEAFLKGIKEIYTEVNQELRKESNKGLHPKRRTPCDYHKVLRAAQPHVFSIFTRAESGIALTDSEKMHASYYLQAVLMLKHLLNPTLTKNLMIKDWLEKKMTTLSNGQKATLISTSQNIIVLQEEDMRLFDTYFTFIRPTQLKKNSKMVNHFFVTSKGQPITNSGKDLERLHKKFQQPLVSAKEARVIFTRWAHDNLSEEDQELAESYMNHTSQQVEDSDLKLYNGMLLVTTLGDGRGDGARSTASKKRKRIEEEKGTNAKLVKKEDCFKKLAEKCPIRIDEPVPTLTMCKSICQSAAQYCQDKWRRAQYKIRIEDVIEHFRKPPTKNQLAAYIARQTWTSNKPNLQDVQLFFRPHTSRKKEDSSHYINDMITSQQWSGLVIVEDKAKGGHALKTSQFFQKGDIVCDYHGVLMAAKDGEKLQQTITEEKFYSYFFAEKGKRYCINATRAPCSCHPNMQSTFGRMMNHSYKKDNVKPVIKYLSDGTTPVILFVAKKNISPGAELFYNYGVKRRQFGE